MSTPGGERSPKRQRRSFSPASPPETRDTGHFVEPPQTPPPSVHMSPSWQSQPLNTAQQGGSGPGSVTFPTPPSTTGFASAHVSMDRSEGGAGSEHQTPAAEGDVKMQSDDYIMERKAKRVKLDDSSVACSERGQPEYKEEEQDAVPALRVPPSLYKLATEPIAPARPLFSENMLSQYDLTSLQASVARRDEHGNKINKLRKSYEGKIKALGVEGKPKARVAEEGPALLGLLDPDWEHEVEPGKSLWDMHISETTLDNAEQNDALLSKLETAMSMKPGRLPKAENDEWVSRVGLDEEKSPVNKTPAAPPLISSTPTNPALARTGPLQALRASAPASPRGITNRPERAGKKRRYDESSYAGYAEGYEDDGYDTGGVDDTGRRRSLGIKKQKRQDFAASTPLNKAGAVGV